jgi:sporulation protein YlmC with PRC-barrel domain
MKDLSVLYKNEYKGKYKWNEFLNKIVKGKKNKLIEYVNEVKNIPINEFENERTIFIKKVMKDFSNLGTYVIIPMIINKNKKKNGVLKKKKEYYTIPYTWLTDKNGKMEYNNIKKKLINFETHPENFKHFIKINEINKDLNEINKKKLENYFLGSDEYEGCTPNYSGATFSSGFINGIKVEEILNFNTRVLFQQNKEYEKNCCFYNCMKHYNIEKDEYKKIKKYDDILKILENLNVNYVIINNYFEFTKKNIMDNLGEKITHENDIYTHINIKLKAINKKIIDKTKKIYYFGFDLNTEVNHIFIPGDYIPDFFINSTMSKLYVRKNEKLTLYERIKEKTLLAEKRKQRKKK